MSKSRKTSSVKKPNLLDKLQASINHFFRQQPGRSVLKGLSKLQENLAMLLLNFKIGVDARKDIVKKLTSCNPGVYLTLVIAALCWPFAGSQVSAEGISHPISGYGNAAVYNELDVELLAAAIAPSGYMSGVEAAITIDVPRKINPIFWGLTWLNFNFPCHRASSYWCASMINDSLINVQVERLSVLAPYWGCDSLTSRRKLEREIRRVLPATLWSVGVETPKVTEMVLNNAARVLGIQLRETEDAITRDMLAATATAINCTGGTNGDNPTELSRSDIDAVVVTLTNANAYTIADLIEGQDRFGTAPVRNAYIGMINSQVIADLQNVQGFIAAEQYPSPQKALRTEWGSVTNIRFLQSSVGSSTANASALGANVFNCMVSGMEAYAFIDQDGYGPQFIYRPGFYNDPLAQNPTVGWTTGMVSVIQNDQWIINLRTTLS